ncbi:MAG: sigma-70 family RNA polymerase sigma factor [Thermoanaerobaculales bacterium]|nr:sigma-70 family RNA polymerase sigma factor [Thermoanaerobaculales bacterium]
MLKGILSVVTANAGDSGPRDDRDLARDARGGDERAFALLVERHSGGLHRAVARILCDESEAWDVVQMAFLKAWQRLDRYDPRWSFATWLYRIGTNVAIDLIRSRKSRLRAHQAGMEHRLRLVGDHEPTSDRTDQGDVNRVLEKVLPALSPQQRAAFVLREIEGLDTNEVAQVLGCTSTTVRNHIFQARKVLRSEIEGQFPEYLPAVRRN